MDEPGIRYSLPRVDPAAVTGIAQGQIKSPTFAAIGRILNKLDSLSSKLAPITLSNPSAIGSDRPQEKHELLASLNMIEDKLTQILDSVEI